MASNEILSTEEIFEIIFPCACRYMGSVSENADDEFKSKSFELFHTVLSNEHFRYQTEYTDIDGFYRIFSPTADSSEDIKFYLKDCNRVVGIFVTLGLEIDKVSKKLQHTSLSESVMFDAFASAYLEYKADELEKSLNLGPHTFRFAPGYGDIPIEINKTVIDYYNLTNTIGIAKTSGSLMLPQKSMITFCGIGKTVSPRCDRCIRFNNCSLRKENIKCYNS